MIGLLATPNDDKQNVTKVMSGWVSSNLCFDYDESNRVRHSSASHDSWIVRLGIAVLSVKLSFVSLYRLTAFLLPAAAVAVVISIAAYKYFHS